MNTLRSYFLSLACACMSLVCAQDYWSGDEYAQHSHSQKTSATEFLRMLKLTGHKIILDVGCGAGTITAQLATSSPQGWVIGIDVSPSMIQTAQKTFSHISNLNFCLQDATAMDFKARFDLITSFSVMHWILEQEKMLQGFHRALKPGGQVWIQMPTGLPRALEIALERTLEDDMWKSYFKGFSSPWKHYQPDEYEHLLMKAHLTPIRVEVVTRNELFPSRSLFLLFLKQWLPHLRPLPDEKKEVFLNDLIDEYLMIVPLHQDGSVNFTQHKLEVEAVK